LVHTEEGTEYFCDKVIIATTITSVLNLIPGASKKNSIYQQIHGQPFLRVYAKFSKASIPLMEKYVAMTTVVPGPLHKVIPYNAEKGIYMIAYTDNKAAVFLKEHLENTPENREFYCRLLEKSLGIPNDTLHINSILNFYWQVGTHFYTPMKGPYKTRKEFIRVAQHPVDGMVVVGEMISMNQGWVQGALESVKDAVTKKWVQN
jgi:hypothetical protein